MNGWINVIEYYFKRWDKWRRDLLSAAIDEAGDVTSDRKRCHFRRAEVTQHVFGEGGQLFQRRLQFINVVFQHLKSKNYNINRLMISRASCFSLTKMGRNFPFFLGQKPRNLKMLTPTDQLSTKFDNKSWTFDLNCCCWLGLLWGDVDSLRACCVMWSQRLDGGQTLRNRRWCYQVPEFSTSTAERVDNNFSFNNSFIH